MNLKSISFTNSKSISLLNPISKLGLFLLLTCVFCRDNYIVMFKRNKKLNRFTSQAVLENNIVQSQSHFAVDDKIQKYVSNGYVATLNPSTVERLKADMNIQLVEKDKMIKIADYEIKTKGDYYEFDWNRANYNNDNDYNKADYKGNDYNKYNDNKNNNDYNKDNDNKNNNDYNKDNDNKNINDYNKVDHKGNYNKVDYEIIYETINDKVKIKRQYNAPWGLSRVTGLDYFKNHIFLYPSNSGENVEVYVIDTGVAVDHPEFQGRARWGINLVEGSEDKDENGHGTHCAGIIGSKSYGLAKKANITAVKVLDKDGAGLISRIIQGIDFVIDEHEERKGLLYDIASAKFLNDKLKSNGSLSETIDKFISNSDLYPKTVVNMSVGGERSAALNFALDYASSLGIHFSVAAGNDSQNACEYSPGSSKHSITTGASTQKDTTADFSNFGTCVDLYAPGVEILSTWNDKGIKVASGTSMATPHTTGAMAMYLSTFSYTPEELKKQILKDSQQAIKDSNGESFLSRIWPINNFITTSKLPLLSIHNLLDKVENEKMN